jgi:hypothetical protein
MIQPRSGNLFVVEDEYFTIQKPRSGDLSQPRSGNLFVVDDEYFTILKPRSGDLFINL